MMPCKLSSVACNFFDKGCFAMILEKCLFPVCMFPDQTWYPKYYEKFGILKNLIVTLNFL